MRRSPIQPKAAPGNPWSTFRPRPVPIMRTPRESSGTPPQRRERIRPPRYTGPDAATRRLVLERDDWSCVCCGKSVTGQPYSLQHRKRRSQGGSNDPSNLVTVLGTGATGCHFRIDSRIDPADEAKGYTCRSWQNPAAVPVMVLSEHGSGMTVWLSADGQYLTEPPEGCAA